MYQFAYSYTATRRYKLKPWSEVSKEFRMKWYGHLLRLNEKTPARLVLKEAERKVKKPKGGQKLTWMELIGKDLEEYKIPICEAETLAQYRTAWRNLIYQRMSAYEQWWTVQMCSWTYLRMSPRCCQIRHIQHWQCSTSCIYISSCHPGSETANSCCTHNTNTSCTSSYTANSIQSSTCSTLTTTNTDTIHWSPSEPDWHSPCCPTPINSKQEATIQASWGDKDHDCPSQMNLIMPWPGMPQHNHWNAVPLTTDDVTECTSTAVTIIKVAHTPIWLSIVVLDSM